MRRYGLVVKFLVFAIVLLCTATEAANVPGDFATIQAAINAVVNGALPDGTVINIQPGTYAEALLIGATPRSMTLRAAGGAGTAVVDATGKGTSALQVLNAPGNIRIEGLKLRNGQGDFSRGGGFTFQGASPTVVNCTVENNSSTGNGGGGMIGGGSTAIFDSCVIQNNTASQFGGGVFISQGSRPTFTNCTIQGNVSGTTSNIGSGGGVHLQDASATVLSSRIVNNRASLAAGGIMAFGPFGSSFGESTLTVEDSDVSNNTAARFAASDGPAEGGGIHVEGNTVGVIRRSTIRNNVANTGGGLNSYRARYIIEDSIIDGNSALDPAAVGGFGGGVQGSSTNTVTPLERAASVTMTNTIVRNNNARLGGGFFLSGDQACGGGTCTDTTATRATLQISNSVIDQNTASIAGGVFATRTNLSATNSLISRNQATGGTMGLGGGVLVTSAAATLTNTRIASNTATGSGGGIFAGTNAQLSASTLAIHNNSAPGSAGGGLWVGPDGNSGMFVDTVFDDNAGIDIVEQGPAAASPRLTYTNTKFGTNATVYSGPPGVLNRTSFGALPNVSGTGVVSLADVQSRAFFMAVSSTPSSVLAWSVIRASMVAITPGVGTFTTNPQVGTADVTVAATTTYTLNATTALGALNPPLATTVLGPPVRFGAPGDLPVPADYDGDGKTDFAVYRASTGEWFIFGSATGFQTRVFGAPSVFGLGDTPVPGDYDGDHKSDIAVYRRATGEWFIFGSATGFQTRVFGAPSFLGLGDTPAPADYDGDGKTDLAIWRSAVSTWFLFRSSLGFLQQVWGGPTDVAAPGDYDGDHKTNIAVWRPNNGAWLILP